MAVPNVGVVLRIFRWSFLAHVTWPFVLGNAIARVSWNGKEEDHQNNPATGTAVLRHHIVRQASADPDVISTTFPFTRLFAMDNIGVSDQEGPFVTWDGEKLT